MLEIINKKTKDNKSKRATEKKKKTSLGLPVTNSTAHAGGIHQTQSHYLVAKQLAQVSEELKARTPHLCLPSQVKLSFLSRFSSRQSSLHPHQGFVMTTTHSLI